MKHFRLFCLLVLAQLTGTLAQAQTSLMATLNHEGTISTFYGARALQQAHQAAASGDVITLSSGTFQAENITKAVTIRGAGMDVTSANGLTSEPTVLANDFSIKIPNTDTNRFTLEGIYHNGRININSQNNSCSLRNALFLKSRFRQINGENQGVVKDLTMLHCRVAGDISLYNESSAQILNSVINKAYTGYLSFSHCVVLNGTCLGKGGNEYKNCIFRCFNNYPQSSESCYNNVFITDNVNVLNNIPNSTNLRVGTSDSHFANIKDYSDSNEYKLAEADKEVLKGNDGTEIGIYGGSMPYSVVTTNPQITKFNVAAKTTADGKLSVDIEVKSGE